jgi:membrane-associated phospholipid phosphatase
MAALVFNSDGPLTRHAATSARFDDNLLGGHFLGNVYFQGSVALGTYLAGYAAKRPGVMLLGADLIRAQLLSGFITDVTKVIVQRERPNGANYSFPSGHTTTAFATATVLQRHYGLKAGLPAYLIGGYVAASRMADNRHYPSDLLVGAAVGIASGRAVTVGRRGNKFALVPFAVPGGGGIALSRVN